MELLGDVDHVECHLFLFGDSISVRARLVHSLLHNIPSAQKSFWTYPMVLLGDEAQVKARLGPFGDRANLDSR
jgi:hypothetical protein